MIVPAYVKHGDLERAVWISPGHERLKKDGQDYGITDDDWFFVLRDDSSVATLKVGSRALNLRLLETPADRNAWHDDDARRYAWALNALIDFCTSFPTNVESVRNAQKPGTCSFQKRGEHYSFEDALTCLGADPLILELDRLFMEGPPAWWLAGPDEVGRHLLEDDLGVWPKLEAWFREQRAAATSAWVSLPTRCTHCDGTGVIHNDVGLPKRDLTDLKHWR
jgi:hypothetical protein